MPGSKNLWLFLSLTGLLIACESSQMPPDDAKQELGARGATVPVPGIAQEAPQLVLPIGHTGAVLSVAFSPDGRYALSGSDDKMLKLWEVSSGREIRTFEGHTNDVTSVAFSPDGRYALSGSVDGTLKLWDVASGREIRSAAPHDGLVTLVAFSPDGRYVLSGHNAGRFLKLWEVPSEREIRKFLEHTPIPGDWPVGISLLEIRTFEGHTSDASSVVFSPDGRYVLSGHDDSTLKLWEVESGREIRTFEGHTNGILAVAFSPDGRYALSGSSYHNPLTLKLWEVESGREIRTFEGHTESYVTSLTFSPDGRYALSCALDSKLRLWEMSSGREIHTFEAHTEYVVSSLAFSPDGRYVLSGSRDKALKLWEVSSGREIRTFEGHTSEVASVAFSPDGRYALSGFNSLDDTNPLKLWELASGREVRSFAGHTNEWGLSGITSVTFSPDGRYALSGSMDKTLKLWEVSSGREFHTFEGHTDLISSVAFSPDGAYALSGSRDNTLKLWEVSSGREIRTFEGHKEWVTSVAFSPDGRYALSASFDDTPLRLWDVESGREIREFQEYNRSARSVAFSPDGRYALSSSSGDSFFDLLKLWEVSSGREIRTFEGHTNFVTSVAFSPDGRHALSGSEDKTLKLWEVASGREIRTFEGHIGHVSSVAFSPDGRYALSGSEDSTLKLWDVSTGELLLTRVHLDEKDWVAVAPDGRFDGSPDGMKLMHYVQKNRSIPLDAFFEQFYTPQLTAQVLSGEEAPVTPPSVDFSKAVKLPPLVRIVSPTTGETFTTDAVEIAVEAVDQGGGVDEIRLYQNGKLVSTEQRGAFVSGAKQAAPSEDKVTRTFRVLLVAGMNEFQAVAFNTDRTESHPATLRIQLEKAGAESRLYLMAVGINKYRNSRYDLNYGRPDAQAFVRTVEARGSTIFRETVKHEIYDEQATREGIEAALNRIIAEAEPQDVFVFYYAGHGVMSEGDREKSTRPEFYLAPTDVTQLYGDDALLQEKGISAQSLKAFCFKIPAQKQLIVLDACQSGGAEEAFGGRVRGAAEEKAIAQLARSTGLMVLMAAGAEQFATEFDEIGHGVFTYAILQGLEGQADGGTGDGKITVKELDAFLEDLVPELTKKYRGESQWPRSFGRGQDFPLGIK